MTDPYSILHVSRTASAEEIKRSYRELALRYHPDKNKNSEESNKKFVQIVEAYRILSDESIRKKFDSDINNARIRFWGYTPSNDQKWIFSNLNELYNRIKERQDERAKSGRSNVRYLGKTTNALIRKGPMVLMNSIASAVKTFTINSRPTEEEASNK